MTEREGVELVVFRVSGEVFALELTAVREVVRPAEIQPLEGDAQPAVGTMKVDDDWVPILDMRERLGLPGAGTPAPRLLIARLPNDSLVGLLVDAVDGIETVPGDSFIDPPEIFAGSERAPARSIVHLDDDRLLVLLTLSSIISPEDQSRIVAARPAEESAPARGEGEEKNG